MAFPRRLLTAGEQVVVEVRPHWSALGWAVPAAAGAVALLVGVTVAWPSAPVAMGEALLAVVGVSAVWLGVRLVRWSRTWLVVTSARVVQRSGVLARRGVELRLTRVNEISYEQSILGHLLGTGSLCIEVGGERGMYCFAHVRKPAALAGVLHEQIAALRPSHGPSEPETYPRPGRRRWRGGDDTPPTGVVVGPWGDDAGDDEDDRWLSRRLTELDDLRRRGLLTEEEFAEQKARLLRER
jgi:membrane protein YdbS with pleckstrin-like domain